MSEIRDFSTHYKIVDSRTGEVVNFLTVESGLVPPSSDNLEAFGYANHHAERVDD